MGPTSLVSPSWTRVPLVSPPWTSPYQLPCYTVWSWSPRDYPLESPLTLSTSSAPWLLSDCHLSQYLCNLTPCNLTLSLPDHTLSGPDYPPPPPPPPPPKPSYGVRTTWRIPSCCGGNRGGRGCFPAAAVGCLGQLRCHEPLDPLPLVGGKRWHIGVLVA